MSFRKRRSQGETPQDPSQTVLDDVIVDPCLNGLLPNKDGSQWQRAYTEQGFKVVGNVTEPLVSGQRYVFNGRHEKHARYGWQFAFISVNEWSPLLVSVQGAGVTLTSDEVALWLNDKCPHVGTSKAKRICETFGHTSAVEVIARQPEKLVEAGILNEAQAQAAAAEMQKYLNASAKDLVVRKLIALFDGTSIHDSAAVAVTDLFGVDAYNLVTADPLILLKKRISSCSFPRVKKLYQSLGLPEDNVELHAMGAWYWVIKNARGRSGHVWHDQHHACEYLRSQPGVVAVTPETAVEYLIEHGWAARHFDREINPWLAEAALARSEDRLARNLARISRHRACWPRQGYELLKHPLSQHQSEKVMPLLVWPILAVLGSPGTGKSYTAAAIIQRIAAVYGECGIAVTAPTGLAATRLTHYLHRQGLKIHAVTIHSLLKAQPERLAAAVHSEQNRLPHKFIIADETSMVDVKLLDALLAAVADGTNVMFIGDPNQLAPVGEGAPLRDLLASGLPHAELTEIVRNNDMIPLACADLKAGRSLRTCDVANVQAGQNLVRIPATTREVITLRLTELIQSLLTENRWNLMADVQVITAKRDIRDTANQLLQQLLNPNGAPINDEFRVGDRVLCTENGERQEVARYDASRQNRKKLYVANGDRGRIEEVSGERLIVRFNDPDRRVYLPKGRADKGREKRPSEDKPDPELILSYCVTGHKFQGSEAPVVIVLADPKAGIVPSLEWWYTGLSRASKLCYIIGSADTIQCQSRRRSLQDRKTFLAEKVQALSPGWAIW
jgi:exodeoxyribonuclease V alpha subunit